MFDPRGGGVQVPSYIPSRYPKSVGVDFSPPLSAHDPAWKLPTKF